MQEMLIKAYDLQCMILGRRERRRRSGRRIYPASFWVVGVPKLRQSPCPINRAISRVLRGVRGVSAPNTLWAVGVV